MELYLIVIDIRQFRHHIVRPALEAIRATGVAAENLLIGTAIQESHLRYIRQLQDGPARGFFQMEPATHKDIWENFLKYRVELSENVKKLLVGGAPEVAQLEWNLLYAAAMCRVHYMRVPHALPAANDVPGLAKYWKQHYNTPLGKGTVQEFEENYERYVVRADTA